MAPAAHSPGDARAPRAVRAVLRTGLTVVLALLAGSPAAGIQDGLRRTVDWLTSQVDFLEPTDAEIYRSGLLAGIAFLLLFYTSTLTPLAWRRVRDPFRLRVVAYLALLGWGTGVGLIGTSPVLGWCLSVIVCGPGTLLWWTWQRSWRGVGVAPSLLAGVLRPPLHAGQVWFAFVPGTHETKKRPVLVLHPAGNNRWLVAYFTTQTPRDPADYLQVEPDTIRGMNRLNWAHLTDLKALQRNQFRSYVGLAPAPVYQAICVRTGAHCDPEAWLLDEDHAGAAPGPVEATLLNALGLRTGPRPPLPGTAGLLASTARWLRPRRDDHPVH